MTELQLPSAESGPEEAREPRLALELRGLRIGRLRLRLALRLGRRFRFPLLGHRSLVVLGYTHQVLLAAALCESLEVAADGVAHLVEMTFLTHGPDLPG
jgi:hypothetical protein